MPRPVVTYWLEFLDEALAEAEDVARWYAQQSSVAAFDFDDELEAAIARIERMPYAWPPHERGTRRHLLHRFPFGVVYRVDGNRIVIVAVAHTSRRPGYWLDRLDDAE